MWSRPARRPSWSPFGLARLLSGLAVLGGLWLPPTPALSAVRPAAPAPVYLPFVASQYSDVAAQVLALVNQERAKVACGALSFNSILMTVAQAHSVDMGVNNFFSHTNLQGLDPFQRMTNAGYTFSTAGENIAAGYPDPQSVMTGWMNSPGHRDNILKCSYTQIGIGYYYDAADQANVVTSTGLGGPYFYYWTQDFGTP